ncbi:MAG: alpha/beta fold hydrolase, partial [Bacteroidota bacterium]
MRKNPTTFFLVLTFAVIAFLPLNGFGQEISGLKKLEGSWVGPLKVRGMELRLVMNISFSVADSVIVTFDSPDQGVNDIPSSRVTFTGDSLIVESGRLRGKFSGIVTQNPETITGTWAQLTVNLPVTFTRTEKITRVNRPQEPRPPLPYHQEEVVFQNQAAGIELAGTLTWPKGSGPFPAAILITGSGPQNRDEELLGHKPYLVLSDYLTRRGIAILRYDDRGTGKSKGNFAASTTFDFASDANAALDFLKKRTEIDSLKTGLIGHSEGGLIASIVASRRPEVDFIVLMAGPGLTGEDILLLQSALISKINGATDQSISAAQKLSKDIYAVLKKTPDNQKAEVKIRDLIARFDKKYSGDTTYNRLEEQELKLQIQSLTSPWFRCYLTLDPEVYLSKVKCQVLAIIGSLDLQVPPSENLQAIEKALIFGGNPHYTVTELTGLNHLFQTAKTG